MRALLLVCLIVLRLGAQASVADRAAVARAAARRAQEATRTGNTDAAWREWQHAVAAWPVQPVYVERLALMAAARGDTTQLRDAVERLRAMQAGDRILRDSATRALARRVPAVQRALDALTAAIAPVPRSVVDTVHRDTLFFAEGLRVDAASGAHYITSVRQRAVLRVGRDGRGTLLRDSAVTHGPVLGVALSTDRASLWLTTASLPQLVPNQPAGTTAELLRVRSADGALLQRLQLGDGTGTPGEITVTPQGEVLVSDGTLGVLYRLPPGASTPRIVRHPLLRSPQGIAVSADGRTAHVADWAIGLLRWDLATDSLVRLAEPDGGTLVGIDGLSRWTSWLVGVQNGVTPARIVGIALDASGRTITRVRTLDRQPYDGEATVGDVHGDTFTFVASSHWPFHGDDGTRRPGASLPPVVLRRLRLDF